MYALCAVRCNTAIRTIGSRPGRRASAPCDIEVLEKRNRVKAVCLARKASFFLGTAGRTRPSVGCVAVVETIVKLGHEQFQAYRDNFKTA